MMAAAAASSEASSERDSRLACPVRECACSWSSFGSPQTPRVAPGRDYLRIPRQADHTPTWSLLVGVRDGAALRLSRLRVARSGQILGRSDDELEFFRHIKMPPAGQELSASAALATDGRALILLRHAWNEKPQTTLIPTVARPDSRQLTLQLEQTAPDTDELEQQILPEIEETSRCLPIITGGQLWALSATVGEHGLIFSVRMRRLGHAGWQQVGDAFTSPHKLVDDWSVVWGRWLLQGYAVLPLPDDAKELILVSFKENGLFFTFATDSGEWTRVPIDATRLQDYVPILGRAVYIEQDQAVYMLRHNTIYAYKLTYCQDDQGRRQLSRLDPPTKVDSVCPFNSCKGYGFLARLDGDRLMCSVWISLASRKPCLCDNLHAIVTTFHLPDPAHPSQGGGGIEVLHSSFRRLDMKPNPQHQEFCFLLEYEDKDSPMLLQHQQEQEVSQKRTFDDPSKMLACCRRNLTGKDPRMCFLCGGDGHIARDCTLPPQEHSSAVPPSGPPRSMPVDPASMQHQVGFSNRPVALLKPATTSIKKDLFIICQWDSYTVIYPTGVIDESLLLEGANGLHLESDYAADDGDHFEPNFAEDDGAGHWHFFHSGSKIHAVSSIRDMTLEFNLNKNHHMTDRGCVQRPSADPFVLVIRVGEETIALTDTLQVFHQTVFHYGSTPTWLRYKVDQSHVLLRKVVISGYVVVNDHSFLVWDAVTCSCLLFDLGANRWRVVMPWAAFEDELPRFRPTACVLHGRCVFVDGFIYTCIDGGLAAYQLLHRDHSVYLSRPIYLTFSWHVDGVGEDMCLDYAGKDVASGAILFYVVQGVYSPPKNDVLITIVQVKTKRTPSNEMKPVRVDRVDSIMRSLCYRGHPLRYTGAFHTRCCFAVSL